eukprot:IDg19879t1
MTAATRRAIVPFLWPCLLGLQPSSKPDDDTLLQASLALDRFQTSWRGLNRSDRAANREEADIAHMEQVMFQQVTFQAGVAISEALHLRVSTKFYRAMRHCRDHLRSVGCARRGDTDSNETLHKASKASYNATNKRLAEIGPQILRVRALAAAFPKDSTGIDVNARTLLCFSSGK